MSKQIKLKFSDSLLLSLSFLAIIYNIRLIFLMIGLMFKADIIFIYGPLIIAGLGVFLGIFIGVKYNISKIARIVFGAIIFLTVIQFLFEIFIAREFIEKIRMN